MKQITLLLCTITFVLNLNAQEYRIHQFTPQEMSVPERTLHEPGFAGKFNYQPQASLKRAVQCGDDTLSYLFSKNTGLEFYFMNDTSSSNYNAAYAQYYDAPQMITVEGGCFYGYVSNTGDSALVHVKLFSAANDSFPDQLLAQTSVMVYDTYSATDIDVMRYCVSFPSSVTLDSAYLLEIETSSTLDLAILSNSYTNNDGAGEGLSFALYTDTVNFPGFLGWYDQLEPPYNWDFDWILEPIVSYDFNVSLSGTPDSICVGDSICVDADVDPIVFSRMYNQDAVPALTNSILDWGDGVFYPDTMGCHIYTFPGNYIITYYDQITGWHTTCLESANITGSVQSLPVANFTYQDLLGGTVSFTNTSMYEDSVLFDLGGGITTNDTVFTYTFTSSDTVDVTLYAYNECGIDSLTQTIILDPTGIEELQRFAFRIYPNPAGDFISFKSDTRFYGNVEVFDAVGKRVKFLTGFNGGSIDISELPAGYYNVRLISEEMMGTTGFVKH